MVGPDASVATVQPVEAVLSFPRTTNENPNDLDSQATPD